MNSIISEIEIQDLKQVMTLGSSIMLFQYSDHLIAIVRKGIKQIMNIDINQINLYFKDNNIFLIVDKSNIVHIFKVNLFYNYLLYQKQGKYLGFYKLQGLTVTLIQCFSIFEYNNKNDQLKTKIQDLKKQNYLIQIKENFNDIQIDKFSLQLNRQINFQFDFSNIFQLRKEQTQNDILYKLKQLKIVGQFFVFNIKSQIYIMFNQEDQFIVIYNFNTSRLNTFNLKINLNLINTYYEVKISKFALVQETLGKIFIFKSSEINQDMITYQIYQFKEQIRISFLNRNLIILQLLNSTEILYENQNTFSNQSLHRFENLQKSNFKEQIQSAIKVLNFYNTFIFQHEQYLLIQTEISDTLIINQKLLLLGGYIKRKNPEKLILLGMNNEMNIINKYLITQLQFHKLSTFNFSDYIPIQPLFYQVLENIFIIITQKQDKDLFHILLFNIDYLDEQNNFEYYDIVSTPYKYFYALTSFLYYYNHNQELIYYNIQYMSINYDLKELNQIAYKEQFQLELYDQSEINHNVYSEKLNLLVLNFQFNLQLSQQINPKIIMKNNQAFINPNNFVKGLFYEFNLKNTTFFNLQTPFRFVNQKFCHYFMNNLCIIEETPFFMVQDLTKQQLYNKTLPIRFNQEMKVYACDQGLLIINQYDSKIIKILYLKQDIESFILIEDELVISQLIQQILIIQSIKQTNYYFINDSITLIQSFKKQVQVYQYLKYHQIDYDKFCQILEDTNHLNIFCYQIISGITYTIQNYTIPMIEIYNQIDLCHYLPSFIQNIKLNFLNLSSTLDEELDLKIAINYKSDLLFYVQIILKNQEYQIKLNNIIRLPNLNMEYQFQLIQNKIICYSASFSLLMYDLNNGFQLLNPYAIRILKNELFSQLNNTHIALYNFSNSILTIYTIEQWRLVKNDNISIDYEQNVTFLFEILLTKLELRVNVRNQIEDENYYRFIKIVILLINNISIQVYIIIFKKKK